MSSGPNDQDAPTQPSDSEPPQSVIDVPGVEEADESEKLVLVAPDAATSWRDLGLWAGIFVLMSLTVFSPALRGDFLWDDDKHVSQNMALRTADGFSKLWVPKTTPQYYPLTHSMNWVLYQVAVAADGTINTWVFHLANTLIHAGSAILLWFILRRLKVPAAWLGAAIFAVHPVQVETVAWISEMKNVLSGIFFFGAVLTYLRFDDLGEPVLKPRDATSDAKQPDWNLYALALGLFVCALLSKSVTCSMPAVMLLIIWWKRGKIDIVDIGRLLPFFVLGLAMAVMTAWLERTYVIGQQLSTGEWSYGPVQRILIAGCAAWFYLYKLLLPINLSFIYPKWSVGSPMQWLAPIALLAGIGVLWAMRKKIGRGPLAATLIYFGMLVPALGFINVYPMRYSFVADHFQYHASAAMIALIVATLATVVMRFLPQPTTATATAADDTAAEPSPAPYVLGAVFILVVSAIAFRHARAFDSSISLWEDVVAKDPKSWMAYNNLSIDYYDLAKAQQQNANSEGAVDSLDASLAAANKAIEIKPDHAKAYLNRGRAQALAGKTDLALADYQTATKVDPKFGDAYYLEGLIYQDQKKYDLAVAAFDSAVKAQEQPKFLRAKASALFLLQNYNEAEAAFLRALEINPDDFSARNDYGAMLAAQEKRVEAANQFLYILRRNPRFIDAKVNLAYLHMDVGNLDKAQQQLVEAGLIDPYDKRVMDAAKIWDEQIRAREAATRAATTRATTTQATTSTAPATAAAAIAPPTPVATAP